MSSDDNIITADAAIPTAEAPEPPSAGEAEQADESAALGVTEQIEMVMSLEEPAITAESEPDVAVAESEPEPQPKAQSAAGDHPVVDAADAVLVEGVSGGLTWVPFACYTALWVAFAGVTAYLLTEATGDVPARWTPVYVPLVWAGIGLTAFGPVLSLMVWLVARARRPKAGRRGLFASAMTRGALIAFFGVAIWLATLFVLEIIAAGGTL